MPLLTFTAMSVASMSGSDRSSSSTSRLMSLSDLMVPPNLNVSVQLTGSKARPRPCTQHLQAVRPTPLGLLPCIEFASAEYGSLEVRQMFFHLGEQSVA